MSGIPLQNPAALERLGDFLTLLVTAFTDTYGWIANSSARSRLTQQTMVADDPGLAAGRPFERTLHHHGSFRWSAQARPSVYQVARSLIMSQVPARPRHQPPAPRGKPPRPTAGSR